MKRRYIGSVKVDLMEWIGTEKHQADFIVLDPRYKSILMVQRINGCTLFSDVAATSPTTVTFTYYFYRWKSPSKHIHKRKRKLRGRKKTKTS